MASYVHTYSPRILLGSGTLNLDTEGFTPLLVSDVQYTNRVRISEVPLQNGGVIYNIRRGPATISFQGMMVDDNKEDVLAKADRLHLYLCGGRSTPSKFTFYRFYNNNGNYRWWRNCACNDLQFHWTSRTVVHIPYSFSITSEDGVEYEQVTTLTHDPDTPAITEYLNGPRLVKLDDDNGVASFCVQNASGQTVARIDSAGNFEYVGTFEQVSAIS